MIVGYARVSTTGQSLDIQMQQLQAAGCQKVFQEKASGAVKDRQQLAAALDYVREGDHLVVCRLDRIARSTQHLLEIVDGLEGKGVAFKVLSLDLDTTTPTGKLTLTLLGGIATFERELMLERQAEGIAKAKAQGKYQGRKPTAKAKAGLVRELAAKGIPRQQIAERAGIGIASVYRLLAEARA